MLTGRLLREVAGDIQNEMRVRRREHVDRSVVGGNNGHVGRDRAVESIQRGNQRLLLAVGPQCEIAEEADGTTVALNTNARALDGTLQELARTFTDTALMGMPDSRGVSTDAAGRHGVESRASAPGEAK